MAVNYKNMQRFVRNTIHPYVVNLRDLWKADVDWLKSLIDGLSAALAAAVENLQQQIDALDLKFTNMFNSVNDELDEHAARTDNPHQVKLAQTAQVSNLPPTPTQGSDGDFWVQYIDSDV